MSPLGRLSIATVLTFLLPVASLAAARTTLSDTSRVFQLGAIEVVALRRQTAAALEEQVVGLDLHRAGQVDYSRALGRLPGLAISNGGQRNEGGLYLRGFDLRQVSLFVDGIPVYVPYDGTVDLHRFTTFDVSQITVSKGFSSVLYGPNAEGGAINVLSRRPTSPLDVSAAVGTFSGSGYQSDLSVGTRRAGWYAQAAGSYLRQRDFPLASDFDPVRVQPAGGRLNAKREDWRTSVKLGLTPNATDEYALVVATQHGEKGNPPYTGSQPGQSVRYWQWPQWDKRDAYLISQTALGWGSLLKGRIYYDHFGNQLFAYDDSTFTTMKMKSSFKSYYDDPTVGSSIEWALPTGAANTLRTTVHGKLDQHREHNAGEPVRKLEDLSLTYAGEDTWKVGGPLTAIAGASYSHRRTLTAQGYRNSRVIDLPTGSNTAWNGELALLCDLGRGTVRGSVAQRTRFATMKDRYSYKMGTAIPNPDLEPENALHGELAYAGTPLAGWQTRVAAFYSRISGLMQSVSNVAMVDGVSVAQMRNVGNARCAGFELGFDATPMRALAMGVSYAYVDRRNLDAPSIKQIGTPRNAFTSYLDVSPIRRCDLRGSVTAYGQRYATSTGLTLASFATLELQGAVELDRGTTLEAGVANLLDAEYQLDEGFPEPGRTYFANLKFALRH
jgi:iron complex outermembrane recepter protein